MISLARLNVMCAAFGRASFLTAIILVVLFAMACKKESSASAVGVSSGFSAPNSAAELDPQPTTPAAPKVDGVRAFQNVKDFLSASGRRFLGSEGHKNAEEFIISRMKSLGVESTKDEFLADTPAGKLPVANIVSKIPGSKDGIIVIAGHYDTNYPLRNIEFVGANDGGSNTGLMIELARVLKQEIKSSNGKLDGYSVWFVFTDGEEAVKEWTAQDSVYGSKHLAQLWKNDGTAAKVHAFVLLDMIGDKDLNVDRETNSTPWLQDTVLRAAQRLGVQSHFYARSLEIEDDHLPFKEVGIPVVDLIDLDYGLGNAFHHTSEDTLDKLSPNSLQVIGDVTLETIRAINTR